MKILVTGFEPFGGETINPAYEAVKLLPPQILGSEVIVLKIPTTFSQSAQAIKKAIKEYHPDAVISVGQAGNHSCVTIEKVAINWMDARIPDNEGVCPVDEPIQTDGETAYFSTVPVKEMVNYVREQGLPCHVSYSAGTYVCNYVMYQTLYFTAKEYPNTKAGFIHVPYAYEQVIQKSNGTPSMSISHMAKAIEYAIEGMIQSQN